MQRCCVSGAVARRAVRRELCTQARVILGAEDSSFEAIDAKGLNVMSGDMHGAIGIETQDAEAMT